MKYPHVVFDVDGTLLDTERSVLLSLRDTLREAAGRDYPLAELEFSLGIPGADALKLLDIPNVPAVLARWEELLERYRDADRVFDGVPELLAALKDSGRCLGVVTSRTRAEFDQDFSRWGLASYFQAVVTADDTDLHKPCPDPLLKYMELAGAAAADVLYIGDSGHDARCAQAAGVDFGLAGWGAKNPRACTYAFPTPLAAKEVCDF